MHQPFISFCLSTYKRPEILKSQLELILKQEYKNFEIIISDNDESASARQIVNVLFDSRLKYHHNPVNLGMVKSFNNSFSKCTGDFVVMITDDDPCYPIMLSELVELSIQYPQYGVYGGCGDFLITNKESAHTLNKKVGINTNILASLPPGEILFVEADDFALKYLGNDFNDTFLLWSCSMVRRDIVERVGGMPDYGSEFLTDHAYMVCCASVKGMVFKNTAYGAQEIRGDNFGYAFESLKEKYIATPIQFYNFIEKQLVYKKNWNGIQPILWTYIGRLWVEYSIMVYKHLKNQKASTKSFFIAFNKAFSSKELRIWKIKFYLKVFCKPIFKLILLLKK